MQLKSKHETNSRYAVSGLSVNCSGATVAVALKMTKHVGFCQHSSRLCFISLFSSEASHDIALDSCATGVCFHPHYPAIIAVGHHTGEVSIFRNADKWAHSELGQTHVDEIVGIDWLTKGQKVTSLVTASASGMVSVWAMKGRNARTKVLEKHYDLTIREQGGVITCMSLIPDSDEALFGTVSGAVLKITLPDERGYAGTVYVGTGHVGAVSAISVCPIAPGLFISVGSDSRVCMRNRMLTEPLDMEQILKCPLMDVSWSQSFPSIVAIAGSDCVIIMNLAVSSKEPIQTIKIDNPTRVQWNDREPGTLIVGCADGQVCVYSGQFQGKLGVTHMLNEWEKQRNGFLSRL